MKLFPTCRNRWADNDSIPYPSILLEAYNPKHFDTAPGTPSVTEVNVNPFDGTVTPLTESESAPASQIGALETGKIKRDEDGMAVPDITELKIELEDSSDNQGRITVYQVEVLG